MPDGEVSPSKSGSTERSLTAPEEAALRSIYDGAGGSAGKIKKEDAVKAVKDTIDVSAFLQHNQEIRHQALESVTEETMAEIFAGIDGDDEGFMTWIELQSVYSGKEIGAGDDATKQELTAGEKAQLDKVFKECDVEGKNRIKKKHFKDMCNKSLRTMAFIAVRQEIQEKALEEATRDAMSDLFAGFGGLDSKNDVEISWDEFKDHYTSSSKPLS